MTVNQSDPGSVYCHYVWSRRCPPRHTRTVLFLVYEGVSEGFAAPCAREEDIQGQNEGKAVRAEEEAERGSGGRGWGRKNHKAHAYHCPAPSRHTCIQGDDDQRWDTTVMKDTQTHACILDEKHLSAECLQPRTVRIPPAHVSVRKSFLQPHWNRAYTMHLIQLLVEAVAAAKGQQSPY